MKTFVKGYWNNNLGDDLFLKILCERYPKEQFYTVMSKNNVHLFKNITNLHIKKLNFPLVTRICNSLEGRIGHLVPFSKFSQSLKLIKKSDNCIEIGGSIFMMPRNSRSCGIELVQRKIVRKAVDRYSIIGCNFGPYYNNSQLNSYRKFFKNIEDICFRDSYSYSLFASNKKVRMAPDIVFTLHTEDFVESYKSPYIVLSVVDPRKKVDSKNYDDLNMEYICRFYVDALHKIIYKGIKENRKIVIMSFCDAEGDSSFTNTLLKSLPDFLKKEISSYSYKNINETLSLLKGADAVVASRYHAMILAWLLNKPVFVFSYSDKISEVIKEFFPKQSVIDLRSLSEYNQEEAHIEFSRIGKEEIQNIKKDANYQFKYLDKLFE